MDFNFSLGSLMRNFPSKKREWMFKTIYRYALGILFLKSFWKNFLHGDGYLLNQSHSSRPHVIPDPEFPNNA
jgi:hypothetical protein